MTKVMIQSPPEDLPPKHNPVLVVYFSSVYLFSINFMCCSVTLVSHCLIQVCLGFLISLLRYLSSVFLSVDCQFTLHFNRLFWSCLLEKKFVSSDLFEKRTVYCWTQILSSHYWQPLTTTNHISAIKHSTLQISLWHY